MFCSDLNRLVCLQQQKNDSTKILAKYTIMRSNCYWFVHSEMFTTEEHLCHLCPFDTGLLFW